MKSTHKTRQLAQDILDYWMLTGSHDQDTWIGGEPVITTKDFDGVEVDVCGTTLCAAGTAVFLSVSHDRFMDIAEGVTFSWVREGAELLGLTALEASKLFYSLNGPAKDMMMAIANGDQEKFDAVDGS